ncbi:galanin receptor type 1-like [Haliotis asinina]|uniref:galanin receptor type 1-like n=1 Tax=Haliotis asinina TaxID=109174 RepID=UPI003531FA80
MQNTTERILDGSSFTWPTHDVGSTQYTSTEVNTTSKVNDTYDINDYYDYDYDVAVTSLPLEELIPVSLAYSITLVFGLCGNFLVIFAVCRYKSLRSITNAFLTSLASADLLLVLICVPVKCAAFFTFSWSFGAFLCKFVHYMQTVSMICSVMTLTVMSIERFIAILMPLRAKFICTSAHARVVIFFTWVVSFSMATPVLVIQTHHEVGTVRKAYWCIKKYGDPSLAILFESYMFVIIFVVPVLVMMVAYTGICCELSRVSGARLALGVTQGGSYTSHERTPMVRQTGGCVAPIYRHPNQVYKESREKKSRLDEEKCKVIQMLIVVVVLFIICWGPILINNLLVSTGVLPELHIGYLKPMRQAFFLMSYMNSCTNPVVYGFMSKNFRKSFKHAILCCCRTRVRKREMEQSFATRTTMVDNSSHQLDNIQVERYRSTPATQYRHLHPQLGHRFNTRI